LRSEKLRFGGKYLGIGMSIRRPLRRRKYTSDNRANEEEEEEQKEE
jgi:hypothetical protein